MSEEQIALIKRTIARGASDDELQMFLHIAKRTGLDPFARQIYAVKRYDRQAGRETMAVQTGIDGYRLVAERTGRYAPGREPTYAYDEKRHLLTATAYVKKQTDDGTWHEVAATAHLAEYMQTTRDGKPTRFWAQMPHVMLAKVAEALALRRAFPMELSGIYTADEMAQSDAEPHATAELEPGAASRGGGTISEPQAKRLLARAHAAGHSRNDVMAWLLATYGVQRLGEIPRADYDAIIERLDDTTTLAIAAGEVDVPEPPPMPEGQKDEADIEF